jgi:hypothetical protein
MTFPSWHCRDVRLNRASPSAFAICGFPPERSLGLDADRCESGTTFTCGLTSAVYRATCVAQQAEGTGQERAVRTLTAIHGDE